MTMILKAIILNGLMKQDNNANHNFFSLVFLKSDYVVLTYVIEKTA